MEWNFLLFIGLALRIYYHIASEDYPYNWRNKIFDSLKDSPEYKIYKEGWKNVKLTGFSFVLVLISWYLCFFLHFDDNITDGWKLIGLWGLYVAIGWAIDSLFLAAMELYEKVIKKWLNNKSDEPKPPQQ